MRWRKVPSVTTGGKDYFYVRNHGQDSIVWRRDVRAYGLTLNGKLVNYYSTVPEAMTASAIGG
jgi:hypothetical protein